MGFHQTPAHKNGKGSYHQIGLVRGQFGNVPMDQWVKFIADTGFDGWEEASWELDLRQCDSDGGAAKYAQQRVDLAKKHGLEIFTVAVHLQGQALGDEPTAKTLQFPPLPGAIGGHTIPDVRQTSLELLVERFAPVLDLCKSLGVTFDLECHPSERAMGDLESAGDYINHMCKAGYEGIVGFNLDGSHMEWQNVSVIDLDRKSVV